MSNITLRRIADDEFVLWAGTLERAFGWEARSEDYEAWRKNAEIERTIGAFDGDQLVGTNGAFTFELTVPGGFLPAAGVTGVSVQPTHRRRGILAQMMRQQLDEVRERGEPLAVLGASESGIYGRFGYETATTATSYTIAREHTAFAVPVEVPGRVRVLDRAEALKVLPAVFDRLRREWPGMYAKSDAWWEFHTLYDPEHDRSGWTALQFAVYELDGNAEGYLRYRVKADWGERHSSHELAVIDLHTLTAGAYAGLWSYVFGVDLVRKVTARRRLPDEPLHWLLADPRRLEGSTSDFLWVRLVDVPAALSARRYPTEGRLVLDVRDDFCPWNAGRFELTGGPDGAECTRTDAAPDLVLDVRALAAAYLGRFRFGPLAWAGRAEGEPRAIRRADEMFAWDRLPWCTEMF